MNISPDGLTVRFETKDEDLFYSEKTGAKPNTVRIIDHYERQQLKKKLPLKIIIQHGQEIFLRAVTHVHLSEMISDMYLAIFSWRNEEELDGELEAHVERSDVTDLPIDENFDCVTIRRNLHHLLESIAHGRSMNSIIQETYEAWCYHRCAKMVPAEGTKESTQDKNRARISISKGLLDMLTNIAHERSMDKIIRDLYQLYAEEYTEEVGLVT